MAVQDPAAIRAAAAKFRAVAETLQSAATQVSCAVGSVTYIGPYGDTFRSTTATAMDNWNAAAATSSSVADQLLRAAAQAEEQLAQQAAQSC
jgi:hypothetical protein